MKILFITENYPILPEDGRDIPIYNLIKFLGHKNHVIDLFIVNGGDKSVSGLSQKPLWLNKIFVSKAIRKNRLSSLLNELLLKRPVFTSFDFNRTEILGLLTNEYDVIWVSPVSLAEIVDFIKEITPNSIYCLGLNDSIYFSYMRQGYATLIGRTKFTFNYFFRLFRVPFIFWCERKLLKKFDIVHVQTPLEKNREEKLFFGMKKKPEVLVAPNGKNEDLSSLVYDGYLYKKVLLMNHLCENKKREGVWFIENIWPSIRKKHIDAEIYIVGHPPDAKLKKYLESFGGVKITGFINDIKECYSGMTISVIYNYQDYGIINRLLDSLAASLPVIISKEVYKTMEGFNFINNDYCLVSRDNKSLINSIDYLLSNRDVLKKYSNNANKFIKDKFIWENSLLFIETTISSYLKKRSKK